VEHWFQNGLKISLDYHQGDLLRLCATLIGPRWLLARTSSPAACAERVSPTANCHLDGASDPSALPPPARSGCRGFSRPARRGEPRHRGSQRRPPERIREHPGGWSWWGLGDAVAHRQLVHGRAPLRRSPARYAQRERKCGENSLRLMIEHFYPFQVAIPLQKLHPMLEIHMEKASGTTKTNGA
jgi:hypothetical protein